LSLTGSRFLFETRVSVKMLSVVRAIVHNAQKLDVGLTCVMRFQDEMTKIGAVMVTSTMLSSASAEVRKQALGSLGCIIDGGNKSAQEVLERHFLGTREERFFIDAAALIELSTESITNLRELRDQKGQADENSRKLQETMRGTLTRRMQGIKQRGALPFQGQNGLETKEQADVTPQKNSKPNNEILEKEDELEMKDHGHLHLLLLVLQAMCEGNNKVMQNYLRSQPDNIRNIDVVQVRVLSGSCRSLRARVASYPCLRSWRLIMRGSSCAGCAVHARLARGTRACAFCGRSMA